MARLQQDRKAETCALLLAAAGELFAERGFDAVSVDEVAERAGRTSGAVYARFGSKQGLLLALLDQWKHTVLTTLAAQVTGPRSPLDQLAAVWENIGDHSSTPPLPGMLLEQELWLRAARDSEVAAILIERENEVRRRTATELTRWASKVGARPVVGPDAQAVLISALLHGLAMRVHVDPSAVDSDTAVRGLAALLGIDAPSESHPNRPHHQAEHRDWSNS